MSTRTWILIFLLLLVAIIFQSFQNHCRDAGNVVYLEQPVFWKSCNPTANEKTNNPPRNCDNPKRFMSQDAIWACVFMVIGSGLAVFGGVLLSLWQERRQVRLQIKDLIQEIQSMIEGGQFDPKSIHGYSINRLSIPIKRFEWNIFGSKRIKLNEEWAKYKQLFSTPEQITKDKISSFLEFLEGATDGWWENGFNFFKKTMEDAAS